MNALAPASVDLVEADVEGTVLGSLLVHPDALAAMSGQINPEWFADPACRLFADAMMKLHRDGHRVSVPALVAAVPRDVEQNGLTRGQVVARLSALALPLNMLSGPISTLKDRWARRLLAAEGQRLVEGAAAIDLDPHHAAIDALATFDRITATKSERMAGTLAECTDAMLERIATCGVARAATTGLKSLDAQLGGYFAEQLVVVAGRPGMGKSAYACSSLRQTAEAGNGVVMFSLEMSRDDVSARCIADAVCGPAAPGFGTILRGEWTDAQGDLIGDERFRQTRLPFHVDATPRLTMPEIASRARSLKARFEASGFHLSVVCIDHMGLVEPDNRYAGNKVAETGQVSRAAKVLAKELGVCVILLCQLSRRVEEREDKRPGLSDLRWSGDIEQDADVVGFLFREAYYLEADPACDPFRLEEAQNRLDFLLRKNRNGATGDIPLWCSMPHSAIRDLGARS